MLRGHPEVARGKSFVFNDFQFPLVGIGAILKRVGGLAAAEVWLLDGLIKGAVAVSDANFRGGDYGS